MTRSDDELFAAASVAPCSGAGEGQTEASTEGSELRRVPVGATGPPGTGTDLTGPRDHATGKCYRSGRATYRRSRFLLQNDPARDLVTAAPASTPPRAGG